MVAIPPQVIVIGKKVAEKVASEGYRLWVKVRSNKVALAWKLKQREKLLDEWEERGFESREAYLKFKQDEFIRENQNATDNSGSA